MSQVWAVEKEDGLGACYSRRLTRNRRHRLIGSQTCKILHIVELAANGVHFQLHPASQHYGSSPRAVSAKEFLYVLGQIAFTVWWFVRLFCTSDIAPDARHIRIGANLHDTVHLHRESGWLGTCTRDPDTGAGRKSLRHYSAGRRLRIWDRVQGLNLGS